MMARPSASLEVGHVSSPRFHANIPCKKKFSQYISSAVSSCRYYDLGVSSSVKWILLSIAIRDRIRLYWLYQMMVHVHWLEVKVRVNLHFISHSSLNMYLSLVHIKMFLSQWIIHTFLIVPVCVFRFKICYSNMRSICLCKIKTIWSTSYVDYNSAQSNENGLVVGTFRSPT